MKLAVSVVVTLALAAGIAAGAPITVGGFTFVDGEQAFADSASLVSGTIRFGSFFTGPCCSLAEVLSGSDISTGVNNNTGDTGVVEVAFTDNRIINGPGSDLVIFELSGPLTTGAADPREQFGVSVFDGATFTPFTYFDPVETGFNSGGDPSLDIFAVEIDLGLFGLPPGAMVDRVRLHIFDVGRDTKSADVAALGALNSVPETARPLLLGLGCLVVVLARRRVSSSC